MSNFIWYGCLAVVSLVIGVYAIYKKRDDYKVSTLIVFYLFAATITWVGEFAVLGLFNSYAYKTGLFTDIWLQNLVGHLLLNTTMYPVAAIVMVAFSLRKRWIVLITAVFILIEYLFMELRLYEHHWWRYYMSAITVVAFLLISRAWFSKMNQKRYGSTRAITFFFVAFIIIHTHTPLLLLLGKQRYQVDWIIDMFGNLYLSSIIFAFNYHLIESFFLILFTCILKKWYWKLSMFVISPVAQIGLVKMNILFMENGWKLAYTILIYEICIALFILIEKYTLKPEWLGA